MSLQPSELILNPDGSVYHLNLRPEQLAPTVVTVGDPERVKLVAAHFDAIEHRVEHREFVTQTGHIGGKPISVISTGIGTDNIDIVMNELDALVNIDLEKRQPKREKTSLEIIRLGTSGSLQNEVPLDSLLVSSHAIGLDGLGLYYHYRPIAEKQDFWPKISQIADFPIPPYLGSADPELIRNLCPDFLQGVTATCAGFYAPQGREIRLRSSMPDLLPQLARFQWEKLRVTNFEMETAGIYLMANLMGHRAISCNAIIANRQKGTFSDNPQAVVEKMIATVLQRWADC